jgi:hypothetical protein
VPPGIVATTVGGENAFQFDSGPFGDGRFISTREYSFQVDLFEPMLVGGVSALSGNPDASGLGMSSFGDSWSVTIDNGLTSMPLLLVDSHGVTPDPFGLAPGPVLLGPAPLSQPEYSHVFLADLGSLAGQNVTVYFDLVNEDDSSQSMLTMSEPRMQETDPARIPEPHTLFTLTSALVLLTLLRRFRTSSA